MWARRAVILAGVAALAAYAWIYGTGIVDLPIRSDGFSYYVYVPSWLLFGDTTLAAIARDCCGGEFPEYTAIIRWPGTRRWVNAHPIGVALMQAPVFPLAHGLTRWTNLTPDGFSLYYQHAAGLTGLAWVIAGLAILRRFLLEYFTDAVVAATLVTLVFGTNLFHYATFDSSYSHPYSFALFAAFLYLIAQWTRHASMRTSILLGLVAGLIVLTRHTNALFAVALSLHLAWRVRDRSREVLTALGTAALVILPQLLIYYQATGRPIVSSYGSLGFNWSSPQVFGVLFGVQKGLFFWSPLLLLGVAGFVLLWRSQNGARVFVPGAMLFLAVNTYLIASWWDWQFGGSFGHRGFVDALPLFAVGLAATYTWASPSAHRRHTLALLVAPLVALSCFQMVQYWYGIIPFQDTSWQLYREVFLQWR